MRLLVQGPGLSVLAMKSALRDRSIGTLDVMRGAGEELSIGERVVFKGQRPRTAHSSIS